MITVTERAASALEALLLDGDAQPGQGVKLIPSGENSIGMTIEAPNDGDEVIRHADGPLLIVDRTLTRPLDGAQIDCVEAAAVDGQVPTRFTVRRPAV
jgi:Fe-S cluster assembly iron-binding protein IscA